jgi:hypothetical protein
MDVDFISLLTNSGLAVAISVFFVFKVQKTIDNNTEALGEIKSVMLSCQRRK